MSCLMARLAGPFSQATSAFSLEQLLECMKCLVQTAPQDSKAQTGITGQFGATLVYTMVCRADPLLREAKPELQAAW